MKMTAQKTSGQWFGFGTAMPEEGRLCLAAAGGCLSIGSIGWMLGAAVPAVSELIALLVVGVLYLLLAAPSLFRLVPAKLEVVSANGTASAGPPAVSGTLRGRRPGGTAPGLRFRGN